MPIGDSDFEQVLRSAVEEAADARCPKLLAAALHHSVFPGGARVRPKLCLAVALANHCDAPALAAAAAASVELLHCASLVHDDMPCFDNADERRGRQSVHTAYGEPIALLAGDALIVSAFALLARPQLPAKNRLSQLMRVVAEGVGAPCGIAAGQAWESEPVVDVSLYHRAKTGALFIAATAAGAAAAGVDVAPWKLLGAKIGEAYQVADDIQDATSTPEQLGKPCGVDVALNRPSAVSELGLEGATHRLRELVEEGVAAVPPCAGRAELQEVVRQQAQRFLPKVCAPVAA
ncbi:polyprenyl synthetase family protein [Congregibacter litoralis]|uniref:Farnesyl-diphosphate synthase n=1 Tax=Congregibacter litoralis KT71 TaxID=314285 RepID=A4ACR5_9GAMM|nr:polyprenyl synthetase family protein [Congregibacter litoralis]EAQ96279.1 farnesyl-diphosphate synthase [Congregibacter litoralis KT71]